MPTFDVVCEIDLQEVDNAVNQAVREIGQRFDFKGSDTTLVREAHVINVNSADDFKVKSAVQLLREKLAKRQIPAKAITEGTVESAGGGRAKQTLTIQEGIPIEKARELVKIVKDTKLKVQAAIQGDQLRITGKKRDDLQAAMQAMRQRDLDIALQFTNFRD